MDRVLDLRGLPPPEPLERTLDGLNDLAPGDRLVVSLHRQPYPLYNLLGPMGYRWEATEVDGHWQVCIEPEPSPNQGH